MPRHRQPNWWDEEDTALIRPIITTQVFEPADDAPQYSGLVDAQGRPLVRHQEKRKIGYF